MDVAKLIESMKNINLKGIMALPKLTDDKSEQKKEMKLVSDLSKNFKSCILMQNVFH